jgi:hypothetical protein
LAQGVAAEGKTGKSQGMRELGDNEQRVLRAIYELTNGVNNPSAIEGLPKVHKDQDFCMTPKGLKERPGVGKGGLHFVPCITKASMPDFRSAPPRLAASLLFLAHKR